MSSIVEPLPSNGHSRATVLPVNGHLDSSSPPPSKPLNGHLNGHHHTNGHSLPPSPGHSSLLLPSDWPPLTGPIDLDLHDRAHASAKTEWWYLNSHVNVAPR